MGALLSGKEREELVVCLKKNKDVFTWLHKDIPGVDLKEAKHYLNIDPTYPPVREKQSKFAPKRKKY